MGFRLKTILGVALIEGALLLMLVWSSMDYLTRSNQDELTKRAVTTSQLLAAMAKNSVISKDLATLEVVVQEMLRSPGIIYVRIMDNEVVLSQAGAADALARPFIRDMRFDQSEDGIFDIDADIREGQFNFGRIELGLSVAPLNTLIGDARSRLLSIAAIEMILVAIFSFFLGTYLTRTLSRLTKASVAITKGELGIQVNINERAELKDTLIAFNTMSQRLQASHEDMARSLADGKALSDKLTQSELRLSTILDTAVDAFITIDQRGIIQSINSAGETTFGYQKGELIGKNVSCLMPTPYQREHDGYLDNYLSTGDAKVIGSGREVVGLRKDGCTFPMDLSVSEMQIGDERMFVGLMRDISERKRMEKEAHRNEATKSAIMEASLDALVTMDRDGLIVEFSPVAEKIFGYAREDVLHEKVEELIIPPALRDRHLAGVKHFFAKDNGPVPGQRIEVSALRSNGEVFPAELTISPIEVEGDVLFTAFIRDISDQKAAENQLRDAKQQAEAASEAKSRFLAHMSHEIRSPLNAVLGSVGLLIDSQLDKQQQLYAHTAQTSGKALLGVINDILDFSKIEAGQLALDHIKFNLRDLISGVGEVVAYRAQDNAALEIVTTLGRGIPAQLMGDPGRLRQVLLNLMDNAAKYTERGAVVLSVSVNDNYELGRQLYFVVEDTGIGISDEAQQRLFAEFSQVDNSDSTRYGGTGLGLAICRQLVELMGGHIGLQSEPGRGSRFWFDIPLQAAADEVMEAVPVQPNCRVMVVGLSPLAREAVRGQWQALGCEALAVGSGREGLVHIGQSRDQPYDVILVDENLADIELQVFAQRLRGETESELVLISNTNTLKGNEEQQGWGYDRVILRPLQLDNLLSVIDAQSDASELGQGVYLPDVEARAESQTFHLLLAEDSPANQLVATALLQNAGYRVDVANNGREAVDAFKHGSYDLVLMDMRMPEMDGIEATKIIRSDATGREIPILAMSANVMQSDIERCMAVGMNDYVTKPVAKKNLLKAIARALEGRSQPVVMEPESMLDDKLVLMDEEVLDCLGQSTSPEQVPAMVAAFLDESQMRVTRIDEGLRDLSLESMRDEVHTLKSLAGTFGALRLQHLVREMDQACRDEQTDRVQRLGTVLKLLFDETNAVYQGKYKRGIDGDK